MDLIGKENLYWTSHVRGKMMQYRLSESRIKRVLRHPKRREVGVAEETIAGMQPAGSPKHPYEIWAMWSLAKAPVRGPERSLGANRRRNKTKGSGKKRLNLGSKVIIISAWRYPGISPVGEPPPIPEDVWDVLKKFKKQTNY
jgi:hypothetical protein